PTSEANESALRWSSTSTSCGVSRATSRHPVAQAPVDSGPVVDRREREGERDPPERHELLDGRVGDAVAHPTGPLSDAAAPPPNGGEDPPNFGGPAPGGLGAPGAPGLGAPGAPGLPPAAAAIASLACLFCSASLASSALPSFWTRSHSSPPSTP